MTTKKKAIWAALIAGITGFLGFISNVPLTNQNEFVQTLQALVPQGWRPYVTTAAHLVAQIASFYAIYNAAHSGPQTPPINAPTPGAPPEKTL